MEKRNQIKKIKFTVEVTGTGYSAYAVDYPVFTTGETYDELIKNMNESFEFYIEEEGVEWNYELVPVLDMQQFFEYFKVINASALANKIHMNKSLLLQYAKGIKKPSPKQAKRIIDGVKEVGKELSSINFDHA